jgi:hypothetical protein
MKQINGKYEGSGGSSFANPIQGFKETRRAQNESIFGNAIAKFGTSLKQFFQQEIPIIEYTKALLELI